MIKLTNKNYNYQIENITLNFVLRGEVTVNNPKIEMVVSIFNTNNLKLADCSYNYVSGGQCAKVLGNVSRMYIDSFQLLLEDTLSFLILRFNLD